jgi:hypothetical protein
MEIIGPIKFEIKWQVKLLAYDGLLVSRVNVGAYCYIIKLGEWPERHRHLIRAINVICQQQQVSTGYKSRFHSDGGEKLPKIVHLNNLVELLFVKFTFCKTAAAAERIILWPLPAQ